LPHLLDVDHGFHDSANQISRVGAGYWRQHDQSHLRAGTYPRLSALKILRKLTIRGDPRIGRGIWLRDHGAGSGKMPDHFGAVTKMVGQETTPRPVQPCRGVLR